MANVSRRLPILLSTLLLASAATALQAAELRDPTRPLWQPASSEPAAAKPVGNPLTAIVIGAQQRRALIGDRYVQVGDQVGDAKLIRIDFDSVVLRNAAGERVLRLTPVLDSRSAAKVNGS